MTEIKRELKISFLTGTVIVAFLLTFVISVLAEEPTTGEDYNINLQALIEQVRENVAKVDGELKKQELKKQELEGRIRRRAAEIREHFERGNVLYKEGKLKGAKQAWQKALEISEDPELKAYIVAGNAGKTKEQGRPQQEERYSRETRKEKRAKKIRQRELAKQEQLEQREKKRLDREKQKQHAAEQKKKDRLEEERLRQAKIFRKKEISSHYRKALSCYKAQNYDIAIQEFNEVLKLDPTHKSSQNYLNNKIPGRIEVRKKAEKRAEDARLVKERTEKERAEKIRQRELAKQEQLEPREKERLGWERLKQLQLEQKKRDQLEEERLRQAKIAPKKDEQDQKREQEAEVIRKVTKAAEEIKEELKSDLEDLSYKTVKECLDVSARNPENKKIFANLVELYLLIDEYYDRGKDSYNKDNWQIAINECQKVLAIDPDNERAVRLIKKAKVKIGRSGQ